MRREVKKAERKTPGLGPRKENPTGSSVAIIIIDAIPKRKIL
jgi:hypothetical protein